MNLTSFLQDKHLTVALRGEIDHHSAKDIMRVLGNKIDLYLPRVCVLDFREVTFMDSSGIAIVISLRAPDAAAARRGHSLEAFRRSR
ncbi:MAG: STAS domain-containing protein [Acutalibacteraceae bacterium]